MDAFTCSARGETLPASAYYLRADGRPRTTFCKGCWKARYYDPRRDQIIERTGRWKAAKFNRSPITFDCLWCGKAVTRVTHAAAGRTKFCSRDCKELKRQQDDRARRAAAKPARRCVWCGVDLKPTMRSDAKFCSAGCNSKAHQSVRRYRRRSGGRAAGFVSFVEIAERDGWRCGICGKPVNRKRQFPDPLAGSLDHLVPVSLGGDHEPANVQLSHFRCNWSKRDTAINEQLRLIG